MGMMVLYFGSRIATVSDLTVNLKRHSLVTASHFVLSSPSSVSQALALAGSRRFKPPMDAQQVIGRIAKAGYAVQFEGD
jgi:hypothetical protein